MAGDILTRKVNKHYDDPAVVDFVLAEVDKLGTEMHILSGEMGLPSEQDAARHMRVLAGDEKEWTPPDPKDLRDKGIYKPGHSPAELKAAAEKR